MASISRNCTDWKPDAGASLFRNAMKSCGDIVSSTDSCSTSSRSISCTRLNRCSVTGTLPSNILSRHDSSSNSSSLNHSS